jgi:hypothetical protein
MKPDCCTRCRFYARSPYLVCAEHPTGVEGDSCPDFELDLTIPDDEAVAGWMIRCRGSSARFAAG